MLVTCGKTWSTIDIKKLIKLEEILDFDVLDMGAEAELVKFDSGRLMKTGGSLKLNSPIC
jgi:hypothetical protein